MTEQTTPENLVKKNNKIAIWLSWIGTMVIVGLIVSIIFWQPRIAQSMAALEGEQVSPTLAAISEGVPREALESMLDFVPEEIDETLLRNTETHTEITSELRQDVVFYSVEAGDAVFSIAKRYNISPESLLWSNYEVLSDDPHSLRIGQTLSIPPTNGIWYEWQKSDTLEGVAAKYKADVNDILLWYGNNLDLTNPVIEPGTNIMIPGGQREFMQWVVPTIARGPSGVSTTILGPGSCDTSGYGLFGTGYFTWPASNHYLSGNDYWSGHLAIDIAAGTGAPIYAADTGMIVYAGPISGGYGNMVMIDHGNGYQTLYAHLSSIITTCGASVYQGSVIGYAGSTGNSTGPHLHFEVRYMGGFINPWTVLP